MNKVRTMEEAYLVFELLGIKEVTKEWQKKQGTEVWELPLKTMWQNGSASINRFSIYKSGYVRKMVVYGKNNASMSCYQLNKTRKSDEYIKDYEWCEEKRDTVWTGKYRKSNRTERIMIDTHQERIVYLCNYILKNYYRDGKTSFVGEYTMERVTEIHNQWWKSQKSMDNLPWSDRCESKVSTHIDEIFSTKDDVQVIINGHRYNLS